MYLMRKILNSRIFRIMVCLVLICCFLVNSSPIKAKAVLAELTLAQWGILALATLLVAGISYSISSQHELEAIGSTYRTEVFSICC